MGNKIKYYFSISLLLILSFCIQACSDRDEGEVAGKEAISLTVVVAPDMLSADLAVATRSADIGNADIETPTLANGGKFTNIVILVIEYTTSSSNYLGELCGVHSMEWSNEEAVSEYRYTFTDLDKYLKNGDKVRVYALANLPNEHLDALNSLKLGNSMSSNKYVTALGSKVYNMKHPIDFSVGNNMKVNYNNSSTSSIPDLPSVGMPINNAILLTLKNGSNEAKIPMKRICARVRLCIANQTGDEITIENLALNNFFSKRVAPYCYMGNDIYGDDPTVLTLNDLCGSGNCTVAANDSLCFAFYCLDGKNASITYDISITKGNGENVNKSKVPLNIGCIHRNQDIRICINIR